MVRYYENTWRGPKRQELLDKLQGILHNLVIEFEKKSMELGKTRVFDSVHLVSVAP
jgi:hypothetical protein